MRKFNEYLKNEEDYRIIKEYSDNSKEMLIEFLGSDEKSLNMWISEKFMDYKPEVKADIKKNFVQYLTNLTSDV